MSKSIQEILDEQMPGFVAVPAAPQDDNSVKQRSVDMQSKALNALKQKYRKAGYSQRSASIAPGTSDANANDLEMIQVVPQGISDPAGPGPKAVIISKQSGEIIGVQG